MGVSIDTWRSSSANQKSELFDKVLWKIEEDSDDKIVDTDITEN